MRPSLELPKYFVILWEYFEHTLGKGPEKLFVYSSSYALMLTVTVSQIHLELAEAPISTSKITSLAEDC